MNLEDELQRLFSDDRLELPVRPEAEAVLARGIGRRRRRRAAAAVAAGAMSLAVVVGGSFALSGARSANDTLPATRLPVTTVEVTTGEPAPPSSSSSTTPPSPPPSSTSSAPTSSSKKPSGSTRSSGKTSGGTSAPALPPSTSKVIGPTGWGRLRLGMSEADAIATGEFDLSEGVSGSPCHRYWLAGHGGPVDISPTYGVARIPAKSGVRTPEGIGAGSTDDEVLAAYPDATTANYVITAPVPGNAKAVYVFNTSPSKQVSSLTLELATSDC